MEESVQCGECGNRYDSNENAFCPRCGSVAGGQAVTAAVASAGRQDPSLRRVRSAGVVLMVLGVLALAQFAYMAIAPPQTDADSLEVLAGVGAFAEQPGGAVSMRVLGDGTDVPVRMVAPNGSVLEEAVVRHWFNATLPVAFVNLTVGEGNVSQVHRVYAPGGSTVSFEVDLAEPQDQVEWHAASTDGVIRTISIFLAFLALVVAGGGYAAWRRRLFGLAVTGGVLAVFPGLIVVPLVPLAGLLLLLPGMVALTFILLGRKQFRRA